MTEFDVTWGFGGPDRTVRCATSDEANRVAADVKPWGPVVKPAGQCPWQIAARNHGLPDLPSVTASDVEPPDAERWLYELGVPRYQAQAFGAYYKEHCQGWAFSAAKREFDYDPRGHALLAQYGRQVSV